MNFKENKYFWVAMLIIVTALSRLLPHPWNFTPVTALFIFGGAKSGKSFFYFLLPMATVLVSDILLNNFVYNLPGRTLFYEGALYVYLAYVLIFALNYILKPEIGLKLAASSFTSSVLFFALTNFAAWTGNPVYSQDLSGLITSYSAGLPFFRNAILGDLFYTFAMFGVFQLIQFTFLKKSYIKNGY